MITNKKKNEKTTEIYFDETPAPVVMDAQHRIEEAAACLCREVPITLSVDRR